MVAKRKRKQMEQMSFSDESSKENCEHDHDVRNKRARIMNELCQLTQTDLDDIVSGQKINTKMSSSEVSTIKPGQEWSTSMPGQEWSTTKPGQEWSTSKSCKDLGTSESSEELSTSESSIELSTSESGKELSPSESNKESDISESSKELGTNKLGPRRRANQSSQKVRQKLGVRKLSKELGTSESSKELGISKSSKELGTSESSKELGTSESSKELGTSESSKELGTKLGQGRRTNRSRQKLDVSKSSKELGTSKLSKVLDTSKSSKELGTSKTSKELSTKKSNKKLGPQKSSKELSTEKSSKKLGVRKSSKELSTKKSSKELDTKKSSKELGTKKSSKELGTKKSSKELGTYKSSKKLGTRKSSMELRTSKSSKAGSSCKSSLEKSTSESSQVVGSSKTSTDISTSKSEANGSTSKLGGEIGNNSDQCPNETSETQRIGRHSPDCGDVVPSRELEVFNFNQKSWMADVTFLIQGKRIYCSKTVLSVFSPVFRSMFTETKDPNNGKKLIELPGKDYDSFLDFLKCFFPNIAHPSITKQNVFKILSLACEYNVHYLIKQCEEYLMKSIEVREPCINTLLRILSKAKHFNLISLKDTCIKILSEKDPFAVQASGSKSGLFDTLQYLQGEIVLMKHLVLKKARIDLEKTCRAFDMSDVLQAFGGFEKAEAAKLELSLKFSKSEELSNKTATSDVICMNGLRFSAESVVYTPSNMENESSYVNLFLKCVSDGSLAFNWSCDVRAKCFLKMRMPGKKSEQITKTRTFRFSESHAFYTGLKTRLGSSVGKNAGSVRGREFEAVVYFLANRPKFSNTD